MRLLPGPTLCVVGALVGNLSPFVYLGDSYLTSQKGVSSPVKGQEAKPGMGSQYGKRGEGYSGRKPAVVLVFFASQQSGTLSAVRPPAGL